MSTVFTIDSEYIFDKVLRQHETRAEKASYNYKRKPVC